MTKNCTNCKYAVLSPKHLALSRLVPNNSQKLISLKCNEEHTNRKAVCTTIYNLTHDYCHKWEET